MTSHKNKQNYRFRTWKFRDRCHLKSGVRQGCFLCLILHYLIQYIHFHSLYIMSHYYAKFKENPCVGTDASTPFTFFKVGLAYSVQSTIFDPISNVHIILTHCQLVQSAREPSQTDWTQIRPNKMLGLIWIQSVWHSDCIPERFFRKSRFWKKSADNKKAWKISQGANLLDMIFYVPSTILQLCRDGSSWVEPVLS